MKTEWTTHTRRGLGLVLLGLPLLGGCVSGRAAPQSTTTAVTVADPPDRAYQRAVQILTAQGALLAVQDPQARRVQGHLHGSKILTVQVTPATGGSRIDASCARALGWMSPLVPSCDAAEVLRALQTPH